MSVDRQNDRMRPLLEAVLTTAVSARNGQSIDVSESVAGITAYFAERAAEMKRGAATFGIELSHEAQDEVYSNVTMQIVGDAVALSTILLTHLAEVSGLSFETVLDAVGNDRPLPGGVN